MFDEYKDYHKFRGGEKAPLSVDIPQYLLDVLPDDKDIRILDIGCGNGQMLYALKHRGYNNIYGIDLDPDAVRWANENGIDCQNIDVSEYRTECSFDFITMNHVLEHLPKKEVIGLLTHIREDLLDTDGKLMIRVPNTQAYTGCYWAYEDFTHETLYTAGSLQYILRRAGYKEVRFIDPDGTAGSRGWKKAIKRSFTYLYGKKIDFWNLMTGGSFHKPSPRIYTWELKVIAGK